MNQRDRPRSSEQPAARWRWASTVLVAVACLVGPTVASSLPASAASEPFWSPPAEAIPDRPSYLYVAGDAGAAYYPGRSQTATDITADFAVTATTNKLVATVRGRDSWSIAVTLPGQSAIVPGGYDGLDARVSGAGALTTWSQTTNCSDQHGSVRIDQADYSGSKLVRVLLRFDMYCGYGSALPLHGQFAWDGSVPVPAGLNPSPDPGNLWAPSAGELPDTGSYAYIEADAINSGRPILIDPSQRPGDEVGGGSIPEPSSSAFGDRFDVGVARDGHLALSAILVTGGRHKPFELGLYDGLADVHSDPVAGSLRAERGDLNDPVFSSRAADEPAKYYDRWFVVDELTRSEGQIVHISFRFCTGCRGEPGSGMIRGAVSWTAHPTIKGVVGTGQRRGGDVVSIDGSDLAGVSSVTIGGLPADIVGPSGFQLRTPALPIGEHQVVITTAGGVAVSPAGHGYVSVPNRALAPTGVRATPLPAGAVVEWDPPADLGDAPITGIAVDLRNAPYDPHGTAQTSVTVDPVATSAVIAPLPEGTTYVATVTYLTATEPGDRSSPTGVIDVLPPDPMPFSGLSALVTQQYLDFAGRTPSSAERTKAVADIRAGKVLPEGYVAAMRNRPEWGGVRAPITRLYSAHFGRLPDASGLAYWAKKLRTGTPLAKASATFAASSEFQRKYGSLSNGGFVDLIYRNVLHRAADASGRTHWIRKLNAGAARGAVMVSFSESSEHVRKMAPTVDAVLLYTGMLRRMPTTAELPADASDTTRATTATANASADPVALAEQLRRSPAYAARF